MIRLANAARTRRCNYERSWCPCGALWRSIPATPISSSLIVMTRTKKSCVTHRAAHSRTRGFARCSDLRSSFTTQVSSKKLTGSLGRTDVPIELSSREARHVHP